MKARRGREMIGDRMMSVTYQKGQAHACDPACRAAGHVYRHTYKKPIPFMAGAKGEVRAPARIFTRKDGTTELYAVDNPPLLIVNGPQTTKRSTQNMATYKMKRNRSGQFVAVRSAGKRKRKAKKNPAPFWTAGALVNAPRHHKKKRKAARSNPPRAARAARVPQLFGFPLVMPEVSDVLAITGGLAGPPMLKGFAMQLLPASVTTSAAGKWGIEAGSYIVPPVAGYIIGGRRALKMVLAGEAAAVGVRLLGQLTAQISAMLPTVGSYINSRADVKAAGLGRRGMQSYLPPAQSSRMLSAYADSRMSPRAQSRFSGRSTRSR
jgi:hypothetical protein